MKQNPLYWILHHIHCGLIATVMADRNPPPIIPLVVNPIYRHNQTLSNVHSDVYYDQASYQPMFYMDISHTLEDRPSVLAAHDSDHSNTQITNSHVGNYLYTLDRSSGHAVSEARLPLFFKRTSALKESQELVGEGKRGPEKIVRPHPRHGFVLLLIVSSVVVSMVGVALAAMALSHANTSSKPGTSNSASITSASIISGTNASHSFGPGTTWIKRIRSHWQQCTDGQSKGSHRFSYFRRNW